MCIAISSAWKKIYIHFLWMGYVLPAKGILWLIRHITSKTRLSSEVEAAAFWCLKEGAVWNCKEISISKIAPKLSQWLLCIYFWSQKYHCYFYHGYANEMLIGLSSVTFWDSLLLALLKFPLPPPLLPFRLIKAIKGFAFHAVRGFPLHSLLASTLLMFPRILLRPLRICSRLRLILLHDVFYVQFKRSSFPLYI